MFEKSSKNQVISVLCANLIAIGYGCVCGWPSPSIPILQSDSSPLETGPLTLEEGSWITAFICVGGLPGNIFYGWIASRYGRKIPLLSLGIPQIISWMLIIFAKNPLYLYISRGLAGLSGAGTFVLIPLFISEVAEDNIRGFLGSLLVLSANLGILIAFIAGNYLSYTGCAIFLMIFPIVFTIGFLFFPETPQSLLRKGDIQAAEKSLSFYRNIRRNSTADDIQHLKYELDKMREVYQPEKKENSSSSNRIQLKDLSHPATKKAFLIGVALVFLNQFNGNFAMLNYTASIFAEAGSSLSPNMSAIVIGTIQCIGTFISSNLVEKAGRKLLIGISAFGIGMAMATLSAYSYCKQIGYDMESLKWVPVASFSFSIFVANLGVLNLPFLVIAEVMPEKIRSIGTSTCMSILWLEALFLLKYFPLASAMYGMHVCFVVFTICSFAGSMFVFFVMPETKGKSFEVIMEILSR